MANLGFRIPAPCTSAAHQSRPAPWRSHHAGALQCRLHCNCAVRQENKQTTQRLAASVESEGQQITPKQTCVFRDAGCCPTIHPALSLQDSASKTVRPKKSASRQVLPSQARTVLRRSWSNKSDGTQLEPPDRVRVALSQTPPQEPSAGS